MFIKSISAEMARCFWLWLCKSIEEPFLVHLFISVVVKVYFLFFFSLFYIPLWNLLTCLVYKPWINLFLSTNSCSCTFYLHFLFMYNSWILFQFWKKKEFWVNKTSNKKNKQKKYIIHSGACSLRIKLEIRKSRQMVKQI